MSRTSAAFAALRASDPGLGARYELDNRARADLAKILATLRPDSPAEADRPVRVPRRLPRRSLSIGLAVAGLTAVALAASSIVPVGLGGDRLAYAATPDPLVVLNDRAFIEAGLDPASDAAALLDAVADRTQALADSTGTGPYAKMTNEGWGLNTTIDGERVTSRVVPATVTTWTAPDGSGRRVADYDGERVDESFTGAMLMWPRDSLSTDPAVLAAQLESNHPISNGSAERLVAVTDLVAEQPLRPAIRAAVLRYLAETPGLAVTGMVKDRAGRTGLAVHIDTSLSGLPERRSLVIDPSSGSVFAAETELTETAGALNVPVPSVISYTSYLGSEFVDGPTQ